jgi:hypothetical protein
MRGEVFEVRGETLYYKGLKFARLITPGKRIPGAVSWVDQDEAIHAIEQLKSSQ